MQFASHPENVATESLAYIVRRSAAAKRALLGFVRHLGCNTPEHLSFRTQEMGADGSIPDLVGSDSEGHEIVIIEAKFWAGLTANQPTAYLKRLPPEKDAILMVVAPALRLTLLWNEFVGRCKAQNLHLSAERRPSSEVIVRSIDPYHCLAVVSWRVLLTHILNDLNIEGDVVAVSDIRQLQGLCERMDEEAFLPVRSEELTSSIPARYVQLCHLIDDVVTRAVSEGLASIDGFRTSTGIGAYYRPMRLHGFGCYLQLNCDHWAKKASTPLWLSVQDVEWTLSPVVKDSLAPLELDEPPRVLYTNTEALIPLRIPVGVDRSEVVEALIIQVRQVGALLMAAQVVG